MASTIDVAHPAFGTEFFGRQTEIRQIMSRIADPRCSLLTLTGIGGTGKTRLAIEAARQAAVHFEDGAYFVDLEQAVDADEVFHAVAIALGIRLAGREPPAVRVQEHIAGRTMLIILDNLEHLTGASAAVRDMLRFSPPSMILATSRTPLRLSKEWLIPVGGLSRTDVASPSVQVFAQVAERLSPSFNLETQFPQVKRVCDALDGHPLAVEMAASWVRALTVEEIADDVEKNSSLLVSGLLDASHRHRSIEVVIEGSWKILGRRQQQVFHRLAAFRGPFDRDAAQAVTRATLPDLADLVDASLLTHNEAGTYRLHPVVRDWAAKQLEKEPDDATGVTARLVRHYASFASRVLPGCPEPIHQLDATQIADRQYENIRHAYEMAMDAEDLDALSPLVDFLAYYLEFKGRYRECLKFLERTSRAMQDQTSQLGKYIYANSICNLGWMRMRTGDLAAAQEYGEESARLLREEDVSGFRTLGAQPQMLLAFVAMVNGDPGQARQLAEQQLSSAVATGNPITECLSRFLLSQLLLQSGEIDLAEREVRRAFELSTNAREEWFAAYCLNVEGNIAAARGDFGRAEELFRSSYDIKQKFDDPVGMGEALIKLGEVSLISGNLAQAERAFAEAAGSVEATGDRGNLGLAIAGSGFVLMAQERVQDAYDSFTIAMKSAREINFLNLRLRSSAGLARLHERYGNAEAGRRTLELLRSHPASDLFTRVMAGGNLPKPGSHVASTEARDGSFDSKLDHLEAGLLDPEPLDRGENRASHVGPDGVLTTRETEILRLAAQGCSNAQIAERLIISPGTVKWYSSQIYSKLNARNRAQAIARANELGLI